VRRRAEEEEAARRRIEEQAAKRRAEEAEAGRRQAESEHARLIDEEEATKRLAEAEGARILAEEEAMRRAEVAARAAEEEAARHRAEEEEIAALMVPEEDLPAEAPAAEPPAPVPPEPAEPESEILLVETPDAGFFAAMGYLFAVIRARRDRDRHLAAHTGALDDDRAAREATLLDLGRQARSAKLASPELADANAEIDEMENRRTLAESALGDVGEARGRLGAELAHAEGPLIGRVEELERQLESVSVEEKATTTAALSSARGELAGVRREHLERRGALDKDEARYRRELAAAEAQVERALRALGSVLDTHRPEEPALRACFDRLDQLASATSKTQATIDRLNAEREAYDRRTYRQGVAALVVACLALATVAIFATLLLL
jgi:hypothetical protein